MIEHDVNRSASRCVDVRLLGKADVGAGFRQMPLTAVFPWQASKIEGSVNELLQGLEHYSQSRDGIASDKIPAEQSLGLDRISLGHGGSSTVPKLGLRFKDQGAPR
jgi:hypothetical protein